MSQRDRWIAGARTAKSFARSVTGYRNRQEDEYEVQHRPKKKWQVVPWRAVIGVVLMVCGMVTYIVSSRLGAAKGNSLYNALDSDWANAGFYVTLNWFSLTLLILFTVLSIVLMYLVFNQEMRMEWNRLGLGENPSNPAKKKSWTASMTHKCMIVMAIVFIISLIWYLILVAADWNLISSYSTLANAAAVPISGEKEQLAIKVAQQLKPVATELVDTFENISVTPEEVLKTFCPSLLCIDLMAFETVESGKCICDREVIESVHDLANEAVVYYIINLVAVGILFLACLALSFRSMATAAAIKVHLKHWEYMQPVLVASNGPLVLPAASDKSDTVRGSHTYKTAPPDIENQCEGNVNISKSFEDSKKLDGSEQGRSESENSYNCTTPAEVSLKTPTSKGCENNDTYQHLGYKKEKEANVASIHIERSEVLREDKGRRQFVEEARTPISARSGTYELERNMEQIACTFMDGTGFTSEEKGSKLQNNEDSSVSQSNQKSNGMSPSLGVLFQGNRTNRRTVNFVKATPPRQSLVEAYSVVRKKSSLGHSSQEELKERNSHDTGASTESFDALDNPFLFWNDEEGSSSS